ncbi:hypothetical protein [Candidatus Carsonella ruddii]|uniref:Putative ribosomal protein L35 n=1 Tax=Candidatus Carsonella ruddii HC isolate Thao2000 TaxID=1202538 RepID=J3TE95_CARRU|nr:hypothetical protein [Candidatus Carsonella ruddii]AFP83957.1 putative ribosomal protein L35 [Candidatus Carsonella ruddii HC isolate Thao2000]
MKIKKKKLKLIQKRIIIKKKIKIKSSNKHHLLINKKNNYLNYKYLNNINIKKIKKIL